MPKISVIMSVYKEPIEWLCQSIDSILGQTFREFEFIIICDNPDYIEGIDLLKDYSQRDNRIVLMFNDKNIGLTKSLNKGISAAKGEYIARMDADDIALSNRFELQMHEFSLQENLGVCGTGVEYFGTVNKSRLFPKTNNDIFLFVENCFAHSSIIAKGELMKKYKYNEECKYAQDYDLWFRMYYDGVRFYNIPRILLKYRTSQQQIGSNFKSLQDSVGRRIRRTSLAHYIQKKNASFNFVNDYITRNDIRTICRYLDENEVYYQKVLFYLAISVDSKVDRLALLFTLTPIFHLSFKYWLHLFYFYFFNKKAYLF